MFDIIKNSFKKGLVTQKIVLPEEIRSQEFESCGLELRKTIDALYGRSLHLREVDTGSCGACESELGALSNPLYDIQRFGIDFVASPRHADALIVTGPVSKNMVLALKKTFDAMPGPKFVITVGSCTCKGGVFAQSYYTVNDISSIIGPVALHIPGCPPEPLVIMQYLLAFLKQRP
ncbi:MAG TPA: NADH-quinone oxidoreductase subunit NuoB [Candidatus Omnitrophota bacterium]|nr:NADH-quinone oxidoreductase subunit NuoB [Candidatus Omnitrophota bacterium]HPT07123.1 NADH-quinone oxidoreductase subunit NuoB [Candidatus Omnitrophota bacterium]